MAVDPDAVHTYHYIPDVAEGLAALGSAPDDTLGRAWMLPCAPAGTLRELDEMACQWEGPFVVDDSRFRSRFDVRPTDPDEAARATVAWAREHYARAK